MKSILLRSLLLALLLSLSSQVFALCKPGDHAKVLWKGNWYKAVVLKSGNNKCYIHYDGYNNSWDEWVGPARIKILGSSSNNEDQQTLNMSGSKYHAGDAVQVKWKGSWWPAHVIKASGNKLYIRYDGYDSSWNEWVGPGRYR